MIKSHWVIKDIPTELLDLDSINPNDKNPREIDKDKFRKLINSIKEFPSFLKIQPIVVDEEWTILSWNMRWRACKKLGKKQVPAKIVTEDYIKNAINDFVGENWDNILRYVEYWEEHERIFDRDMVVEQIIMRPNISSGSWNMETLANGSSPDFLSHLGMDVDFIPLDRDKDENEDKEPKEKEEVFVMKGDLFKLWNHIILCWDATSDKDTATLMGKTRLDCVWTDPPYNVDYEGKDWMKIQNDKMDNNKFYEFLYDSFVNYYLYLKPGGSIYVAHADTEWLNFRKAFIDSWLKLSWCLIWNKPALVLGRSDYQWKHEPILYWWKEWEAHSWYWKRDKTTVLNEWGDFIQVNEDVVEVSTKDQFIRITGDNLNIEWLETSILNYDKPKKSDLHPTMKPISLIEKMVMNSTKRWDYVWDFFSGSGSTLICCEKLGRKCRSIEFDELYLQRTIKRYFEYTNWQKEIKCLNREFDLSKILVD